MTSITIPNSVTTIGDKAFENCSNLREVEIGKSVLNSFKNIFSNSPNITSVTIEDGVKEINACTFENCTRLKKIIIPQSVSYIGDRAFQDCMYLTEVRISVRASSTL